MSKFNTKSRLELAHLKRQFDLQRKSFKPGQKEPKSGTDKDPTTVGVGGPNNWVTMGQQPPFELLGQPPSPAVTKSKYDYKFVFTNSALKGEDRPFRLQNPGTGLSMDINKVLKQHHLPTSSFLPFGVTIRNPHMFEEDQLALIQRRQETHNPPTYPIQSPMPMREKLARLNAQRDMLSKALSPNRNHANNSANDNEGSGPQRAGNRLPLSKFQFRANSRNFIFEANSNPNSYNHNPNNTKTKTGGRGSTKARDTEFRQRFDSLEASKNSYASPRLKSNRKEKDSKQIVDKLSSTIQELNNYEKRLTKYLDSKNTKTHAHAALKQLRIKRSKTMGQLSQMTILDPDLKEGPGIMASDPQNDTGAGVASSSLKSALKKPGPTAAPPPATVSFKDPTASKNQVGSPPLPALEAAADGAPVDEEKPTIFKLMKAPLNFQERDNSKTEISTSMSPVVAATEMDSYVSSNLSRVNPWTNNRGGNGNFGLNLGVKREPTASRYRYHKTREPTVQQPQPRQSSTIDPPNFYTDPTQLFVSSNQNQDDRPASQLSQVGFRPASNDGLPSKRESEVIRKAYQDFHIHEDKVRTELMRKGKYYDPRKVLNNTNRFDASARRVAKMSQFLQNSIGRRETQKMHHV